MLYLCLPTSAAGLALFATKVRDCCRIALEETKRIAQAQLLPRNCETLEMPMSHELDTDTRKQTLAPSLTARNTGPRKDEMPQHLATRHVPPSAGTGAWCFS